VGVKEYLLGAMGRWGSIHMTLLDPDKLSSDDFLKLAIRAQEAGTDALMVGGSLGVTEGQLDEYIGLIKDKVKIPIILFPGSLAGISSRADALFFLSVMNSTDPYFIVGAQVQASVLLLRRFRNLEVISLAYIIVGDGGAVGYVSSARPIPYGRDDLAVAYAYAAQLMGFDMIYLEAGSGAREPVGVSMVSRVKSVVSRPLIVGGGIRDPEIAYKVALAGADAVVTGTIIEEDPGILASIVKSVHEGGSVRKNKPQQYYKDR